MLLRVLGIGYAPYGLVLDGQPRGLSREIIHLRAQLQQLCVIIGVHFLLEWSCLDHGHLRGQAWLLEARGLCRLLLCLLRWKALLLRSAEHRRDWKLLALSKGMEGVAYFFINVMQFELSTTCAGS